MARSLAGSGSMMTRGVRLPRSSACRRTASDRRCRVPAPSISGRRWTADGTDGRWQRPSEPVGLVLVGMVVLQMRIVALEIGDRLAPSSSTISGSAASCRIDLADLGSSSLPASPHHSRRCGDAERATASGAWAADRSSVGDVGREDEADRRAVHRRGIERFDDEAVVGVDADVGGDLHRLAGDLLGVLVGVDQRACRGQRIVAARADRHHAMLRLQHVAGAGERQRDRLVGDQHHRLQPAQIAVGAPVLGEFDAGAGQLVGILFELGLQPLEQGEGVGGGAGETGDHVAALADAAHLAGVALHDGLAEADLAVAGDHDLAALAHGHDRRGVHVSSFDIDFSDRRDPDGNTRGTSCSRSYVCSPRDCKRPPRYPVGELVALPCC